MIRAITFDLWNTLLEEKDYTEYRINSLSEILGTEGFQTPRDALMKAYGQASDRYRNVWEANYRHFRVDERVDYILKILGVEPTDDAERRIIKEFEEAFYSDPPVFKEGARETLERLEGRYAMGIISDTGVTPGSVIRDHLRRCGILRHFASTVFSDELGLCKPDPRVFRKALQELMVQPDEAMHVGDLLRTDVAGAKGAGMKAIWLKRERSAMNVDCAPDYVIARLSEILDILDQC